MGDQEEFGPYDPRRYQDGGEALEGEIVLPPREPGRGRSQHQRAGNQYGQIMDEDLVRNVIEARVIKGWTLQQCADTFQVSVETVRRWANQDAKKNTTVANVLLVRAEIAASLALVAKEAWRIHGETGDRKLQLDALARVESVDRTRALLLGANAPVRHDVTLATVTEAERELQEMINEAKATEAAREAEAIRAASEDPDL